MGESPGRPWLGAVDGSRRRSGQQVGIGPCRMTVPGRQWPLRRRSVRPRRADARTTPPCGPRRPASGPCPGSLHPRRVETVHRLVQDQQLRVAQQTRGDAESLAHPHRVLRHGIVGPMGDADPLERRLDPRRTPAPERRPASAGSADPSDGRGSEARRRWRRPGPTRDHDARDRMPSSDIVPASARVRPNRTGSEWSCRHRSGRGSRTRTLEGPGVRPVQRRRCRQNVWSTLGLHRPGVIDIHARARRPHARHGHRAPPNVRPRPVGRGDAPTELCHWCFIPTSIRYSRDRIRYARRQRPGITLNLPLTRRPVSAAWTPGLDK